MKKIILILVIVALVFLLTACGENESTYIGNNVYGNVNYSHAYINVDGNFVNVEISRWGLIDKRDIIQLELKDGTTLMVDAENCILYNGTLPTTMPTFEQRVIEAACNELDVDTNGATLTLVSSEYVPWLDCECYNYILTLADGSRWFVGAGENEDGFDCDVECEVLI